MEAWRLAPRCHVFPRAESAPCSAPCDTPHPRAVAAQIGTTGAMTARKIEGATVREFNASPETFMELKNNGVDAVVNDLPVVQYFIKTNGAKDFKMVGEVLSAESYGIAMNLKNTELAAEVNKALADLKKSGEYDKIYEKWFGQKSPQK